jgi:hypothetical protein
MAWLTVILAVLAIVQVYLAIIECLR